MGRFEIFYRDRASGRLVRERVHAEALLHWLYNTRSGRLANALLFRRRFVSLVNGWIQRRPSSRARIAPFVRQLEIDMSESLRRPEEFESFNAFFTREIDLSRRPIRASPDVCVAPCDGRVLAYPALGAADTFRIKRHSFNLARCLGDAALARRFAGGSLLIGRLAMRDYHHFHFSDSGVPGPPRSVPGNYHVGGPYALTHLVPFYAENHRAVTLLESDHFGLIAMVEIGAMTVGSIRQRFEPGARVEKGQRKGWFELGGSTIALVFEEGRIALDADLCASTQEEIETFVRMGERIGGRPPARGSE